MKKKLYTIALILTAFATQSAWAQDVEFKASNFKDQKDEFKAIEEGLETAEPLFEAGFNAVFNVKDPGLNFKKALAYYTKAQEFNPNSALNNFHLGICYYYSSEPYKAIPFFLKAKELNDECDPFLYFYVGAVYQLEEKFNEALEAYKYFEASYKKADDFTKFVLQRKKQCATGKEMKAHPQRAWVDNMESINTSSMSWHHQLPQMVLRLFIVPTNPMDTQLTKLENMTWTSILLNLKMENGKLPNLFLER